MRYDQLTTAAVVRDQVTMSSYESSLSSSMPESSWVLSGTPLSAMALIQQRSNAGTCLYLSIDSNLVVTFPPYMES